MSQMAADTTFSTISGTLRSNRDKLGIALINSLIGWGKYEAEISDASSRQDFANRETVALVDYLSAYFATGEQTYRDLYIGEKLKQCFDPSDTLEEAIARRRVITTSDERAYLDIVGPYLAPPALEALETELRSIQTLLTHPGDKVCRALLVGDCVFVDLLGFLAVPLMKLGVQLAPTFVTNKLPSQQSREIGVHVGKEFDLIFYNPLTYAYHVGFSQFQHVKAAFPTPSTATAIVEETKQDIKSILQLLNRSFSCPIFVHNTANLRRHDGSWRDQLKTIATKPARAWARRQINTWLAAYLEGLNSAGARLILVDEMALLQKSSEVTLSCYYYHNGLQHPARFGRELAPLYERAIFAQAVLAKKKVIICDLDNTLWDGVIGDGEVSHFADRQNTLLRLRKKGMLLAICSKNDPKNVHWRGGTLCEDDFVCHQINWSSKTENIRRIAKILNLKTKDFVFIDDRADELALVQDAIPEILTLDANDASTWSKLALLADLLPENSEGDRTLAYKQRAERERFLTEETNAKKDDGDALIKLQLRLNIRRAGAKELSRVAELVNRTNQFNTCGTRTSLQEVTRWSESKSHTIWILEAADRFGDMGTIAVAIVEETNRGIEIPTFVLSCRVFGFGMEDALLNMVKRSNPGAPIFGHYRQTAHNEPCRDTYPRNGFTWEEAEWVFRGSEVHPDPRWLTVECPV